ncbi:hypothetical protein [Aerococcus urinae]|uniref:Uncharacterized protein n=1 Tax=Aerococcus urinae TaxID=1376 RepID=A0A0X8FD01_9LACT|nr:hypothetical protein [Aerococcus urinae]AMB95073.1 hypothetical protein AWM73_00465 [Aerococcus urinae]MCY3031784.1 hypothetical protein [Aerococcus urinae]MCY3037222.1 hypothetical protein [Aerococcus urinae]MCY3043831.1 hypothetical protein [Aerococcus urinae]MCY3046524.1 hypothetical protein [Aerococcus urinae]
MKKFSSLFIDEMNRSKSYFLGVLSFMLGGETLMVLLRVFHMANLFRRGELVEAGDLASFTLTGWNNLIYGGVFLALALYTVLIWQRDWEGKGRLVYRLMTYPGSRLTVALAKWATILTMVFALLGIQLIYMAALNHLLNGLLPNELYRFAPYYTYFTHDWSFMNLFLPFNGYDFIASYSLGSAAILVIFNSILIYYCERANGFIIMLLKLFIFLVLTAALAVGYVWLMASILYPLGLEIFYLLLLGALVLITFNILLLNYRLNHRLYC